MDLVLRATFIFTFIWLVTRVIGRRELSTLEPFDVILLIVIGDMVEGSILHGDYSLFGAVTVVSTFALLTVAFSWLSFRWRSLRPLLEGEPLVLVQDGEPIMRNLKRERITLEEIKAAARQQQIDDLANVRFAVLETSGAISFLTR